jgi:hypothetical protein
MLKNADAALYVSKARGRNCYQLFSVGMGQPPTEDAADRSTPKATLVGTDA